MGQWNNHCRARDDMAERKNIFKRTGVFLLPTPQQRQPRHSVPETDAAQPLASDGDGDRGSDRAQPLATEGGGDGGSGTAQPLASAGSSTRRAGRKQLQMSYFFRA